MSIAIGETKMNMDMVKLYPSKTGMFSPIIIEYNDKIAEYIRPNGLMYAKGETAVSVDIGYKLVIHIEGKSKMATVILLKKQLEQYSRDVFKTISKFFGMEDVKVRVFINERSKGLISQFIGELFTLVNISSYEVMTVNEKVPAVIY